MLVLRKVHELLLKDTKMDVRWENFCIRDDTGNVMIRSEKDMLVVEGNGAVISGLAVIPAEAWKREAEGIYSLPFDPMSNFFRRDMSKNYWLPGTQIWFVNGKAAPNLLDRESLEKTPNGFWWNKKERKVLYHLPAGKQLADLKIQLPANYGFYIHRSHTIVRNFTMMFSWNDGFDAAETPKHAMYVNCLAYNSCGQGMSIHDASDVYYEECGAVNCASASSRRCTAKRRPTRRRSRNTSTSICRCWG